MNGASEAEHTLLRYSLRAQWSAVFFLWACSRRRIRAILAICRWSIHHDLWAPWTRRSFVVHIWRHFLQAEWTSNAWLVRNESQSPWWCFRSGWYTPYLSFAGFMECISYGKNLLKNWSLFFWDQQNAFSGLHLRFHWHWVLFLVYKLPLLYI